MNNPESNLLGIGLLTHKISRDLHELRRRYIDYYIQQRPDYPDVMFGSVARIGRAIMEIEACGEELEKTEEGQ